MKKLLSIATLALVMFVAVPTYATTKKTTDVIDHADFTSVTNDLQLIIGEKILADTPFGLGANGFEYGIEYDFKKRNPHYWHLVTSLIKADFSGSTSACTVVEVSSKHSGGNDPFVDNNGPDGDNDADDQPAPTPAPAPKAAVSCGSVGSSLDTLTLSLGVKRHWHIGSYAIQPYLGAGLNLMNADLTANGSSDSATGLGAYLGGGIVYAPRPVIFQLGVKIDYDPINIKGGSYNFGGNEVFGGIGLEF